MNPQHFSPLNRVPVAETPTPATDEWIFPSVNYDFDAAGVGRRHLLIEIDQAEVERILNFYRERRRG